MADEDQGTSKLNRGEASSILFLVKKLIYEGVRTEKILVISPYKAQGEGCSNWNINDIISYKARQESQLGTPDGLTINFD